MDGLIDGMPPQKKHTGLKVLVVAVVVVAIGASFYLMVEENNQDTTVMENTSPSPYPLTAVQIPESARGELVIVKGSSAFSTNSASGTPTQAVPSTSIHNPPPPIGELGQPPPVPKQL